MRRLVLLTVLALGTTATQADSGLFYVGAGVTDSSLTWTGSDQPVDLSHTSWKAFAGVRPLNWLAVEADYIDLGSGTSGTIIQDTFTTTTHVNGNVWAAYAVGFLPVPLPWLDFYGKAGVARWKLNVSDIDVTNYFPLPIPTSTSVYSNSFSHTDFAWGVGAQAHVKMFGVRLEYEGLRVDSNNASVGSLSVFLNF